MKLQQFGHFFARFSVAAWPFASALPAQAADIEWNGFFTTGVAVSDNSERYQRDVTKAANIVNETWLGLNMSRQVTSTVRAAAQFLVDGSEADTSVKADWAFVSYRPVEELEIVIGKQKMPIWMVSSYLDVGMAYPWIHPPEEVYEIFNLKAFTGASVFYSTKIGSSTLTFTPYGGEAVIETDPNAPTKDSKLRASNLFGGEAEWRWGASKLRAGFTRGRWDLNLSDVVRVGERRIDVLSYGATTEYAGFMIMAEYAATFDHDEAKYQALAGEEDILARDAAAAGDQAGAKSHGLQGLLYRARIGGSKAYYVTTGYHAEPVGVYLTYANLKSTILKNYSNDQTSTALGVNIDLTPESVLKFETKRVSLPDGSKGKFRTPLGKIPSDLDGTMFYRMAYNLIF